MNRLKESSVGILLIILSFSIVTVSAFVYESAQQTVTQTIVEVATITLQNSALGNIDEGDTTTYTKTGVATLGDAISITTTKASVYLHLDSDLESLTDYSTYNIVVKFSQVVGSTYSVGDTASTLTLASPDTGVSPIDLDAAGTWKFDFEITTTPSSVDADTPTTVTIDVTAEST